MTNTFTKLREVHIDSLNITVEEYNHNVTGACHIHLNANDNNNVFLVGFLTVPQDSTGVAHILEHTSLCGSRRFPVRDPFFMMIKRSLNTFMNAFTSSDWTAYPFSSQNKKDFDNLLQVYLDATFFPNLNELDFAQEGHRVEFAETENTNSELVYKGVVFNEMKGAMSAAVRTVWHKIQSELFPTITYHHNSGGEPSDIPHLTHEQLCEFHRVHYHPSNAIFMTYGDRPASEHQEKFEKYALKHFDKLEIDFSVPDEQRFTTPKQVSATYALDAQEDTKHKTHILLGWLWDKTTDIKSVLTLHLLSGILLDNSASPLRHVLETTDLGQAPSSLCGFDDHTREGIFICGLEGSEPDNVDAVEKLILDTLEKVAKEGIPQAQVESVLHQIELSQREITGDHYPYGLGLIVNSLSPALHGGDPIATLDIDQALNELRKSCQDANFIPNLVKKWLLDNSHRVRLVMSPDTDLAAKKEEAEKQTLAALKTQLTDEDKQKIIEQTKALQARQEQSDDPEILPKVGLEDIPEDLTIPVGEKKQLNKTDNTWFERCTNGLVYQAIVMDMPELEPELLDIFPLFCDCLTEVGCGEEDYLTTAEKQAAYTGGISARLSIRNNIDDIQKTNAIFAISGKALVRNQAKLTEILRDTLEKARFDELPRLRELVSQYRMESDHGITGRGHVYAMMAASSGISPTAGLLHRWDGLAGIQFLRQLDNSLEDDNALQAFADKLIAIRDKILQMPFQFLTVGEKEHRDMFEGNLYDCWTNYTCPTTALSSFAPAPVTETVKQVWQTSTQVNFCAKAYRTVPATHPDAPALTVLGGFLRNNYLHKMIREKGGAYGSVAVYQSDTGAFRFASYRDPHLIETLAHFDKSLDWLQTHDHEARTLEEAILGVISQIDRPGSPAGEAMKSFYNALHQRTPEQQRTFRSRILAVTLDDLKRVAATYLQPEMANIAVLTNEKNLKTIPESLGLKTIILQ